MKKRGTALLLICCLMTAVCFSETGSVYGMQQAVEPYTDSEILVVFEDDVNTMEAESIVKQQDGQDITVLDTPREEITGLVELPEGQSVQDAVEQYQADPDVTYAQPNYKYKLADNADSSLNTQTAAELNDARADSLWHLDMIHAKEAWELIQKLKHTKTRVAVLDTGVELTHPDLKNNVNSSLCVDLSSGKKRAFKGDDDGHGTHVTGIIAAAANNSIGVAGVATVGDNTGVEAFVVDVFSGDPRDKDEYGATTAAMVAALQYAVDNKAKVINMSVGYDVNDSDLFEDRLLESAVNKVNAAGSMVVAAAGNAGNTIPNYPADFDSCVSVISVGKNKQRSSFSNYGETKDISAPGSSILSTDKGAAYTLKSGTSMATPVVSGAAALLYSVDPNITPKDAKNILYQSAEDIYTKGWDMQSGYGIVNAYGAVAMMQQYVTSLKLNKASLSMSIGQTEHLQAAAASAAGENQLTWTSSNPDAVSVDAEGTVTANGYGTATITVKSGDALGASATCKVTVPYTIDYQLNGGKNNSANPSSYYGRTISLKNPVRAGYTFAGWYKDSGFRSKVTSFSSGTYTLYAKWTKVTVPAEAVKKLKQSAKTKVTVTYKRISGAKYQTAYSTNRNFTKAATKYKSSKTTSIKLTGLKKGKTYYVKVRAYKSDSTGRNVYGKYSSVKKIKLKK